jgi:hypothetical protein
MPLLTCEPPAAGRRPNGQTAGSCPSVTSVAPFLRVETTSACHPSWYRWKARWILMSTRRLEEHRHARHREPFDIRLPTDIRWSRHAIETGQPTALGLPGSKLARRVTARPVSWSSPQELSSLAQERSSCHDAGSSVRSCRRSPSSGRRAHTCRRWARSRGGNRRGR